jgi:bifunctional DNA-binding transcriptional regulator/antitoxin component of YhaV-PrlF toxin-antitoxin module
MVVQRAVGAVIETDGTINLPTNVLQKMGWKEGDSLYIQVVDGEQVVLSKRPGDIAALYAGAFTDLYPDPEDTRRFLDEGRGYTEDDNDAEQ